MLAFIRKTHAIIIFYYQIKPTWITKDLFQEVLFTCMRIRYDVTEAEAPTIM